MAGPSHTHTWVSVIVPIKDERDDLIPLTEQLIKVLESCDESCSALFEILFIDDGSTYDSSDVLDRLAADDPRVRVLHFVRNYGQSSAVDAGFKHSVGALVITIDGDLQNDPADIGTLLPLCENIRSGVRVADKPGMTASCERCHRELPMRCAAQ